MLITTLIILYIFTFILLLVSSIRNNESKHRFIFKMINCSLFVIISIVSFYLKEVDYNYFIPLIIAQGLSLLGDIFLGLKHISNHKTFGPLGVLFFGLAQILFIITFIYNYGFNYYLLFIPVLGLIIGEFILYKLNIHELKMKVAIGFYMILMTSMFMVSLGSLINGVNNATILVAIGGFSFMISDYTLIFKYYYPSKRRTFTIVSVSTYAIAQLLFSLSIFVF